MYKVLRIKKWLLPIWLLLVGGTVNLTFAEGYLSPTALVATPDGQTIYIALAGTNELRGFDVAAGAITQSIALPDPGGPSGLALSPDGRYLYITKAHPMGEVQVLSTAHFAVVDTLSAGHTPVAPVVSPDGATLYICNRFDNSVTAVTLADKREVIIPVRREPVAAAVTPDGRYLLVANLLPTGAATGVLRIAGEVTVIDTTTNTVAKTIQLPNGAMNLRGICISPDGAYAYVTHNLARYYLPANQIERGWTNTNALSVIELAGLTLTGTVLLDDLDQGAANPWAVTCSADGAYLCVTHAGTHELSVVNRSALHTKLAAVRYPENDLGFMAGIRRRLTWGGKGPRALTLIGTNAYAAEYFNGSLGWVDIDRDNAWPIAVSLPLGAEPALTDARQGEIIYHSATTCFQQWLSCSTCHTDARADALNWDQLNDGFGNAKQTKSHLYSHRTPPTTITGCRPHAEASVRAGLKFAYFNIHPESDAVAVDAYLKSLQPVPSPYLVEGRLSEAAQRGKLLFEGPAGCVSCHPSSSLFTDRQLHDVGSGIGRHAGVEFDTPTLVEVWRTAPYLYLGQAATMEEVLTSYNPDDRHGSTSGLNANQIADLAEYVLSIGPVP